MLILDLWGISFHAVVIFGLGKNLLFKYILGRCAIQITLSFAQRWDLPILCLLGYNCAVATYRAINRTEN